MSETTQATPWTPGPYMVGRKNPYLDAERQWPVFCTEGAGRWIAAVDTEENALLLAAAPTMYAALKLFENFEAEDWTGRSDEETDCWDYVKEQMALALKAARGDA